MGIADRPRDRGQRTGALDLTAARRPDRRRPRPSAVLTAYSTACSPRCSTSTFARDLDLTEASATSALAGRQRLIDRRSAEVSATSILARRGAGLLDLLDDLDRPRPRPAGRGAGHPERLHGRALLGNEVTA
jgi:hypothetical protein